MSYLNNKRFLAGIVSLVFMFVLLIPVLSFSAGTSTSLIQCGNTPTTTPGTNEITGDCTFTDAIGLINRLISGFIGIAWVIFTITLVYGGFLYITSGENPGNKEKAKKMLGNTVLGFILILTAWLIVYTILVNLIPTDSVYHDSIFRFIGTGK